MMNINFYGYPYPQQPMDQQQLYPMYGGVYPQQPTMPMQMNITIDPMQGMVPNMTQFNPGLVEEQIEAPKSVGLPMDNLITEAPVVDTKDEDEILSFSASYLVTEPPVGLIQNKFAAQAIPVEMDRSMLPKPQDINSDGSHNSKNQQNITVGKKVNNWFTRLLDQKGEDYIESGRLTIEEVSRNAERIIDDMISGRIDYSKQSQYIIQPIIIETLINYCANKLAINRAIQFALGYVYNDYTNKYMFTNDPNRMAALANITDVLSRNMTQSMSIVNQDIGIYEILYQKFIYVNTTKNASSLFNLPNDLNNYKKQMKKRY